MNALQSNIIREITPLSDKDCFYIAERYKTEFTYPSHNHAEFELNFTEKAAGVRRIVGDSAEVISDYDLVLITGKDLEHVWAVSYTHLDVYKRQVQHSLGPSSGCQYTIRYQWSRKNYYPESLGRLSDVYKRQAITFHKINVLVHHIPYFLYSKIIESRISKYTRCPSGIRSREKM